MGNCCLIIPLDDAKETKNLKNKVDRWLSNLDKLRQAQREFKTKKGQAVKTNYATNLMTNQDVICIRNDPQSNDQIRLIMNKPFVAITRILDNLFLTGVAGLTCENVQMLNINVIVNCTHEMPIVANPNLVSVRVPVDDDPTDDIYPYFHDVTDFIHCANLEGYRTVVHCVAGASRSSTVVIAYLIKHLGLTLKDAFMYVHAGRSCARPNMGFFAQLIRFEKDVHDTNTVQMKDYLVEGGLTIRVPDFYQELFPELYQAEMKNQLKNKLELKPKGIESNLNKSKQIQPKVKNLKETYEQIDIIRSTYSKN